MKKVFDFIIGICVWAGLGYGIYYFFFAGEPEPLTFTQEDFEAPLSTYKAAEATTRDGLVTALALDRGGKPEDHQHFINCMGDFAENKLQSLAVSEVFDWCLIESENNRERFTSHYNEIDAMDEPRHAVTACESFIEADLIAPTTAEHPSGGQGYIDHGKGKYTITSYVDAQNTFGAMIRTNYHCVAQYTGIDAPWHAAAWRALELQIIE